MEITQIAVIHTDLPQKFGIPRQAGLVPELTGRIEFLPKFRDPSAVRGLEGFSHIWLLWEFFGKREWSPTVRPPRLGGEKRVGVFATRSPNRPNRIGLSSVRLLSVNPDGPNGPELLVAGPDLLDGTRIYDIKPYLPYTDCHPEATGGFTDEIDSSLLEVEIPPELLAKIEPGNRVAVQQLLALDPRGAYEKKPGYVYGMRYGRQDIRFREQDGHLVVTDVIDVTEQNKEEHCK